MVERDGSGKVELAGETVQFASVGFGEGNIQVHARRQFARAGVQANANRETPAGDEAVNQIANLRFEHFHLARQVHGNLALLAVHRAELDGDLETVLGAISAPITRH